ncbi:MAG: M20/M25/M40 family metallo-hydrolase [Chloroflexi bacterium]|nr:M20/M25/M40 family metallo-hydrolase [Chloroflexota bacterium]
MLDDIFRYIDEHADEFVQDVVRLCQQPSISAQGVGLQETAELVARMLEEAGATAEILPVVGGPPVVRGALSGRAGPTLLFYNHYDVQPPDPLEEWQSPPFQPRVAEGKIVARGASDNKGNLAARLAALKAWRAVHGELPASVIFCIEGEEEVGSPHFLRFLQEHRDRFAADVCLNEGFGVNSRGQLQIILGAKGLVYVELEVQGPALDVHSSWATVIPNPAWRLVWALSTLKGPDDRILIEGFYDDVRLPSAAELAALEQIPPEDAVARQVYGVSRLVNDVTGVDFWRKHLLEPTCNICGLVSGYTGAGAKTITPRTARAKLDFRLVPDQRPDDILQKLRRHLDRHGFSDVILTGALEGEPPARTPPDHPFVGLCAEVAEQVYGVPPVIMPTMAATVPMAQLRETLGVPVADAGVGYPDNRIHAPNEHIRIADYLTGIKYLVVLLDRLPSLRTR